MGVRIRVRLLRRQAASQKRVSLLNFEPRSQNFLVTVATSVAAVTHTTMGSLLSFSGY